jgi:uncharacterized protein (TIGR02001 family)
MGARNNPLEYPVRGGGGAALRLLAAAVAVSMGLALDAPRCLGADSWGGSLGITSDYFVRGITRTNDRAALQLDVHYVDSSGLVAGLFGSNTQIDPYEARDVELNGYLGFSWSGRNDWHGRILGGYYAYPWNAEGSSYNYAELEIDMGYQDWLDVGVTYSPDAPRYRPYRGLVGVSAESIELNLQHPLLGKLSGVAGVGYYELGALDGLSGMGYVYGSIGASYDLAPVALAISYVDTSAAAKRLYYEAAATGRWTATVIWRF